MSFNSQQQAYITSVLLSTFLLGALLPLLPTFVRSPKRVFERVVVLALALLLLGKIALEASTSLTSARPLPLFISNLLSQSLIAATQLHLAYDVLTGRSAHRGTHFSSLGPVREGRPREVMWAIGGVLGGMILGGAGVGGLAGWEMFVRGGRGMKVEGLVSVGCATVVDGVLAIMMLRAGWKSGWGMVAIAIVQLSQVAFWIDGNEWTWIVVGPLPALYLLLLTTSGPTISPPHTPFLPFPTPITLDLTPGSISTTISRWSLDTTRVQRKKLHRFECEVPPRSERDVPPVSQLQLAPVRRGKVDDHLPSKPAPQFELRAQYPPSQQHPLARQPTHPLFNGRPAPVEYAPTGANIFPTPASSPVYTSSQDHSTSSHDPFGYEAEQDIVDPAFGNTLFPPAGGTFVSRREEEGGRAEGGWAGLVAGGGIEGPRRLTNPYSILSMEMGLAGLRAEGR